MAHTIRIGQIGRERTVAFAVQELMKYLKLIDQDLYVDILLEDEVREDLDPVIWVGLDPSFELPMDPYEDTIAVSVEQGSGFITGSNPRSVLIAVYRFLRSLGVRFLHPGRTGERIPHRTLAADGLDVTLRQTASLRHRGLCIEGADAYENILETIDFLPKVGMNEYFVQFMVPSEFFERWYEHRGNPLLGPEPISRTIVEGMTASLEDEIKKRGLIYHKVGHGWTCEPFGIDGTGWSAEKKPLTDEQRSVLAEVNGVRELWGDVALNTNLCYSRADIRDKITTAITDYARNNPQVDIVHFWLADGSNNHCECEACRRKRPADWYVTMLNELDDKMNAAGLKTRIVFLIYVDLLWEPVETKLHDSDRFILMFAPITRDYGKNYSDFLTYDEALPPYERNHLSMPSSLAQNLEHLRRWQKQFDGDSFDFDYHLMWAHVGDPGYEACAQNLFQDMKDLPKIGLNGMNSCQVQRAYLPTALPVLAMAEALWNTNADYETVSRDYYLSAFGSIGPDIGKILKRLSALFHLYDGLAKSAWGKPGGVKAIVAACCEDLPEAKKLVADLKDLLAGSLVGSQDTAYDHQALLIYAGYLELQFEGFECLAGDDPEAAKASFEKAILYLWESEPKIQPLLDVPNTVNVLKGLIGVLTS